jgi:hypothetical protein
MRHKIILTRRRATLRTIKGCAGQGVRALNGGPGQPPDAPAPAPVTAQGSTTTLVRGQVTAAVRARDLDASAGLRFHCHPPCEAAPGELLIHGATNGAGCGSPATPQRSPGARTGRSVRSTTSPLTGHRVADCDLSLSQCRNGVFAAQSKCTTGPLRPSWSRPSGQDDQAVSLDTHVSDLHDGLTVRIAEPDGIDPVSEVIPHRHITRMLRQATVSAVRSPGSRPGERPAACPR